MVIALAGCVGLLLALVAIPALSRAMAGLLPPLLVTVKTLVYGVIAALVVGFASGILPAYGAMRMRVVDCPSEGLSMLPKLIFGVVITLAAIVPLVCWFWSSWAGSLPDCWRR